VQSEFTLHATGAAADWLFMPGSIEIPAQGKRNLEGYIRVPCDAVGRNEFTITAVGTHHTDSAESEVRVVRGFFGGSMFTAPVGLDFWMSLLLLALIATAVLLYFFARRLGVVAFTYRSKRRRKSKCSAESFGGC
jgi:hypothetical protein